MPQAVPTIEEYASQIRKKDTIFIVFNTVYNDVHSFHKDLEQEDYDKYLNPKYTDNIAKEEFLEFMKTNLPDIQISPVFDLVSLNYLQWKYLGSFAIDTDIDSSAYKLLSEKYGNPYDDATVNNKVLWIIEFDFAKKHHDERMEIINSEFDLSEEIK